MLEDVLYSGTRLFWANSWKGGKRKNPYIFDFIFVFQSKNLNLPGIMLPKLECEEDMYTESENERLSPIWTYTHGQTDGRTDAHTHTDRHTHRQTYTHTHTHFVSKCVGCLHAKKEIISVYCWRESVNRLILSCQKEFCLLWRWRECIE